MQEMRNGIIGGEAGAAGGAGAGPKRMANLELLRCVAMMMVVVLHYLGKGGLLTDLTKEHLGGAELTAWLLECFCAVAVNVYMILSGYFLCLSSFKLRRLIQLYLQLWCYSVLFGLIGALSGVMVGTAFDTHYLLTLLFPVSMEHYWFMTAYVYLYLLLPFVGMAVRRMTKRQLQMAMLCLLFAFCILKSVLPLRLEMDGEGYDCLWYLCVFLSAAYVRRFGLPFLEKKRNCRMLYAGGCLLIFAGTMGMRAIYFHTGSLERMIKMCLEYNHILPFAAAWGLFGIFAGIRIRGSAAEIVNRIAPYSLGVYLLHENLGLRYTWQNWLGAGRVSDAMQRGGAGAAGLLLLGTAAAAAAVFICGILTDMVRRGIFSMLYSGLLHIKPYRGLVQGIEKADRLFAAGAEGEEAHGKGQTGNPGGNLTGKEGEEHGKEQR